MRRRRIALLSSLSVLVAAAPAPAQTPVTPPPPPPPAATPPPPAPAPVPPPAPVEPRIKPGVTAGGTDVSGLTLAEAAARIEGTHGPRLSASSLVLGVAGRPWTLPLAAAKFDLDEIRTAKRAMYAKVPGDVPLAITFSRRATKRFVASVAAKVARAPRNASARITLRRVSFRRDRIGYTLDQRRARRVVDAALADPAAPRTLHLRLSRVRAKVTLAAVRRSHNTVITVDKRNFRLRLFKGGRIVKTYGVAVGLPAYPTPSGLFAIQNKQVNPTWSVPNSPWAGELAGTTVQGGTAANPLKARWMGIVNGVGIHGTGEEYSIGSRASHGCIRMRVADVIDLFRRVPVGAPVLLG
jgi:lipoprotein-anchoring transpeptidase ErfK/SrfK